MIDLERGIARSPQRKREGQEGEGSIKKRGRKLKYDILERWGEEDDPLESKDDQKEDTTKDASARGTKDSNPPQEDGQQREDSTTNPVVGEEEDSLSLVNKEVVPDIHHGDGEPEGAGNDACSSPSRGDTSRKNIQTNRKDRQTSIDAFITSARKKIQTDIHTVCSPAILRTPRTNTKKLVMKKESGRKRKTAEPSSGSITKYLVKERKDTGDDKGDRGGSPCIKETDRHTDILRGRQPTSMKTTPDRRKTSLDRSKTTFKAVASVSDRVRTLEKNMNDVKCVMGSGMCGAHNVKLVRSVKQKKYSCVNKLGQVEWKMRDVTCLICPSQAQMNRTTAKTENPTARGKVAED